MSRCVRDRLGARARAVVLGVQSRACQLSLDSGGLLVLGARDVPLAPNGLAVGGAPERLRVGQAVALSAHDPGAAGADWLVLLGGATVWDPRPHVRQLTSSELAARVRTTRAVAIAEGARTSLLPLVWTADGDPGSCLLCAAAARGDAEAVAGAARRLAGLGPGLTPAGDDLLAGFAAAWTLVGESLGLGRAGRLEVTNAVLAGARAGASPLGRAWLAHAVRGEVPEPMTGFFEALFAPQARDLVPAVRGVLAVGASSGTDWTVGFLLGAAAVLPERPW